jgi:hypothetical protein
MRQLTDHIVPGDSANHQLTIKVLDEPGQGGACHEYLITGPSAVFGANIAFQHIVFQNGPIKEVGVNGVTHEALLAILIDRLRSFQAGPYACLENRTALDHLLGALSDLQSRIRKRIARNVEGTNQV